MKGSWFIKSRYPWSHNWGHQKALDLNTVTWGGSIKVLSKQYCRVCVLLHNLLLLLLWRKSNGLWAMSHIKQLHRLDMRQCSMYMDTVFKIDLYKDECFFFSKTKTQTNNIPVSSTHYTTQQMPFMEPFLLTDYTWQQTDLQIYRPFYLPHPSMHNIHASIHFQHAQIAMQLLE